jgi:hypothetical protein
MSGKCTNKHKWECLDERGGICLNDSCKYEAHNTEPNESPSSPSADTHIKMPAPCGQRTPK